MSDDDYTIRDGPDGYAIVKLRHCRRCGGKASLWADCPMPAFHAGDDAINRESAWVVRCESPAKGGCGLSTPRHPRDRVVIDWWNEMSRQSAPLDVPQPNGASDKTHTVQPETP